MKNILYISNIQVPYRERFFESLAKECNLTVLYERSRSSNRNNTWAKGGDYKYHKEFLDGINIGNESSFSLSIIKHLIKDYDVIVIGCYSTPVQMFANLFLRLIRKKFYINFDGEIFADDKSLKSILKKFFIKGGSRYLIAGERSRDSLLKIVKNKLIFPYYFSSLSKDEIIKHRLRRNVNAKFRSKVVLVIGQYFPYKGMDVAVEAAKLLPNVQFKFVGMGNRTDLFLKETKADYQSNIQVFPFLQKSELEKEYENCGLLVLPSRQECWGLVINEAASYGIPIVSTYGSGAAIEFLFSEYPCLLAKAGDAVELATKIRSALQMNFYKEYTDYLLNKSTQYSIEECVRHHIEAFTD